MKMSLVVLMVCGLGFVIASNASADNSRGVCNSIVGEGLGTVFQMTHGVGDLAAQCGDLGATLSSFATNGCFVRLEAGELALSRSAVLGNDPERLSPLGEAICNALVDVCGFGGLLPPNVCPEF